MTLRSLVFWPASDSRRHRRPRRPGHVGHRAACSWTRSRWWRGRTAAPRSSCRRLPGDCRSEAVGHAHTRLVGRALAGVGDGGGRPGRCPCWPPWASEPWSWTPRGNVLGDSAPRLRRFFRGETDWHRWLASSSDRRPLARAVTGWSNAVFLFIVISGAYLWLPRVWKLAACEDGRAVQRSSFREGARLQLAQRHRRVAPCRCSSWSCTAMPISFPWANALIYRAAGEAPPPAGTARDDSPQARHPGR